MTDFIYCPKCKTDKNPDEFCRNNRRKNGKSCYCKACMSSYDKTPERQASEKARGKRRWAEHTPEEEARAAARYQANKETAKAKSKANYYANIERCKKYGSDYAKAHPEKFATYHRTRRAHFKNAPVNDLTHLQWIEIQAAQGHRCAYCGIRAKGHLTQDHIIPLSKGGSHTASNVVAACRKCNAKKGDRPVLSPVQPLLLTIAPSKPPKKVS